jgi:putative ABC transport system permease protein
VLVSLLSLVVSFALAWVALPLFNPIVDESYIASDLLQPGPAAIMALVAVGAGLLAGSYPALALSGFQPVSILKTSTHAGGGAWLRRALVLFQFAATIVLLVCTLVVYQQTEYMRSRDLGLEQEHLVVMPIGFADLSLPERYETVKARFAEHPKVVAVTAPWGVPAMWSQDFTVEPEGAAEALRIDVQGIDNDFLETFGMKLVAGRNVDVHREGASEMLLNETAVRALGWEDPIGKSISWQQGEGQVVGVVADYHAGSMHNPIRPILLCDWLHLTIVVRIAPDDVPATMAFLEDTWHSFVPERPFEARFLDEVYDGMYWSEESQGRSFATLSGLAIFVACLGLLGLSAFSAGQRTREIGIRRVLGASQPGVVLLLSRESVGTVLLATVAAWPTAWWATRSWLQDYPYAVELSPVLFLMAGLVVLLLALVTFASQALRVASSDPVEALRYE